MTPLRSRVIVEPIEEQRTTAGGIYLPDVAQQKSQRGRVIAVGQGRELDDGSWLPLLVRPGDTVLYAKYGGTEIKVGDDTYLILNELDIHCILERLDIDEAEHLPLFPNGTVTITSEGIE